MNTPAGRETADGVGAERVTDDGRIEASDATVGGMDGGMDGVTGMTTRVISSTAVSLGASTRNRLRALVRAVGSVCRSFGRVHPWGWRWCSWRR